MAKLDMTWECNVKRTDEIGILANSLNTMSKELSNTMNELESANKTVKGRYEAYRKFEQTTAILFLLLLLTN